MFRLITSAVALSLASTAVGAPVAAAPPSSPASADSADDQVVCKHVVSAKRKSKPFQMCLTKAQWAAKEAQDIQDANRIVCRYEDVPGSKLSSRKICQPASEWAEQRRMTREQIEDMQMRVCVPGGGC